MFVIILGVVLCLGCIDGLSCWCNVQTADLSCVKGNHSVSVFLPPNAFGLCHSTNPTLACLQRITWPWPQEYSCEDNESAKDGVIEYTVLNGELHTYVNYCAHDLCLQKVHPASCPWNMSPIHKNTMTNLICACNSGTNCTPNGKCSFEGIKLAQEQFPFCRYWKNSTSHSFVQDCFIGDSAEDRKVFRDAEQNLLLCRDQDMCNSPLNVVNIFENDLHCIGMEEEKTPTNSPSITTNTPSATTDSPDDHQSKYLNMDSPEIVLKHSKIRNHHIQNEQLNDKLENKEEESGKFIFKSIPYTVMPHTPENPDIMAIAQSSNGGKQLGIRFIMPIFSIILWNTFTM